ncbi:MAG: hydrogenase maturation protease [Armatimonadetes bacterium]|nr:hydrogenase maturation protease [Armatimonadota bacterium]
MANDLAGELRLILTGNLVVVGVGDERRGDDGVGLLMTKLLADALRSLQRRDRSRLNVIDAGTSPELETWRIRELAPDVVLFVDAVDFGGSPGDAAFLKPSDLRAQGFDTHRAPLRLTMEYLEAELGVKCRLLAVQPKDIRQNVPMSNDVAQSVQRLVSLITKTAA